MNFGDLRLAFRRVRMHLSGTLVMNSTPCKFLTKRDIWCLIYELIQFTCNFLLFLDSDGLITCSSDKTVKLWRNVREIENDKKILSSTLIDQRQYAIYAMDVSLEKNLLVVSSMDGVVKIWDLKDWNLLATIVPPGKDYFINIDRMYLMFRYYASKSF